MQNEVTIGISLTVLLVAGVLFWLFSNPKSSGRFLFLILWVIAPLVPAPKYGRGKRRQGTPAQRQDGARRRAQRE